MSAQSPLGSQAHDYTGGKRPGSRRGLGDVLFVHGMLEDERTWHGLANALDAPLSIQPHFPWSGKGGSYWGIEKKPSEWIAGFFEQRACAPRIIVCHSYGCNATLEYLLFHANPVVPEMLVLISPFYSRSRADVSWSMLIGMAEGLENLIRESIAAQDPRNRYTGWLLDDMVARIRDRLGVYGWVEFLQVFLRSPDLPLQKFGGQITRIMIISGLGDRYSNPASSALLASDLPAATLLNIEGGGHFVQTTHSVMIACAIAETFAAIETGRT